MSEVFLSGNPMDLGHVPERARPHVSPDAPLQNRMRFAGGALPLAPEDLFKVLLFLSQDPDDAVRKRAVESLLGMPTDLILPTLQVAVNQDVLDAAARVFRKVDPVASVIALNSHIADDTLRWLAGTANMAVCDVIGRNQVRALRYPAIVEALWLNPKAGQGVVQGILELAVREGLPLEHIAGFREMKAILAGEERDGTDEEKGLSDVEFALAMAWATASYEKEHGTTNSAKAGEPEVEERSKNMQAMIQKMSVSQKVRLAMVGDANVRNQLIRDPKKIVALAVLKSPRITEGEVTKFAGLKSLPEDLMTTMCRNRNWTKDYATRRALVFNPKTPITFAMTFLRTLSAKDVKDASGSREVSQTIQRTAKRMISDSQNKGH